jgi:5'-3' exonuclease
MISRTALIDADSIIYKIAWVHRESTNLAKVLEAVDDFILEILVETGATKYLGFLGEGKCFRYDAAISQPYKGNRAPDAEWVTKYKEPIKKHMVDKWKFILLDIIEADDAVSICQRNMEDTIICGQDKDLLQVPGHHYNYSTKEFLLVDTLGTVAKKGSKLTGYGEKFFWGQMITGDSTDGILGLKGKGPAFAVKVLKDCKTYEECRKVVLDLYLEQYNASYYAEHYILLRMLEIESKGFTIPTPVVWKETEEEMLEFDVNIWKNQEQDKS